MLPCCVYSRTLSLCVLLSYLTNKCVRILLFSHVASSGVAYWIICCIVLLLILLGDYVAAAACTLLWVWGTATGEAADTCIQYCESKNNLEQLYSYNMLPAKWFVHSSLIQTQLSHDFILAYVHIVGSNNSCYLCGNFKCRVSYACLWQYLDTLRQFIHENLRHLQHSPSVQMHDIPPDSINLDNLDEIDPDTRNDQEDLDRQ